MRFIDYDKLHNAIYKKIIEYTPPALRDEYGRGYAEGLHRALYVIECQDKFTEWDNRKKLLQPEHSDFDWSIVNAMLEDLSDMLPDTNKAHGGGWLQDWLKNFMWENSIDPAYLLMEEKDEGTEKEISR
ncbi:hypothetical protein [Porcincola intestinalis]|uniref:Uncharacterized protein n=1 Tax=Porcincola intestinalis TaxID=2606632 RepID=A0A6L5XCC3_9FIRM|nr:hypothetical protein [Porcincola intestinalis]MSS16122.1 hypothetical protein [Porcincola intestinalis]